MPHSAFGNHGGRSRCSRAPCRAFSRTHAEGDVKFIVRARPTTLGIAASAGHWREASLRWREAYFCRVRGMDPGVEAQIALEARQAENRALDIVKTVRNRIIRRIRGTK